VENAFTIFPMLSTRRLILRRVETSDAAALFAIKSDPQVTAQYGQEPHQSIADTLRWIERLQADYPNRETLFWALTLKEEHTLIGGCPYWNFSSGHLCAELGYELHPAYWGQGLMGEALTAVLDYGFGEMGLRRVEATPLAENQSSRRLLEKKGFRYEGSLRQRHLFRGLFLDQTYYGLLREEWLTAREGN
jgi:[ribosomal protein S5]-alanine N-acetyltransferase